MEKTIIISIYSQKAVFLFQKSSIDDVGDETNVELWNKLVGTGGEELNTFKFSLGTWTVFRRLNRKFKY